jgi:hypothetical protein
MYTPYPVAALSHARYSMVVLQLRIRLFRITLYVNETTSIGITEVLF